MRPDWWAYIEDAILLKRLGIGAAELFEMPTESRYWREAQRTLAYMLEQAEMIFASSSVKLG
jgi:hypothetical protein